MNRDISAVFSFVLILLWIATLIYWFGGFKSFVFSIAIFLTVGTSVLTLVHLGWYYLELSKNR